MKSLLGILICIFCAQMSFAQGDAIKEAWNKGKELANNQQYIEAKPYLLTVYTEMPRPLCCYFLGLAYDLEGTLDSAEYYYKECMANSRKPQLRAWDNLSRLYLRQLKFEEAYKMAWEGVKQYPGNEVVLDEFKEICRWSYAIKHLELDKEYLTDWSIKETYKVGTVVEQYLIVKNIRDIKDQHLHVGNRMYKGMFEEWNCKFNGSKKNEVIKFELKDRNLDRALDKMHANAKEVYNNKEEDLMVRLGALLSLTPITDKMMLDLVASDKEEIRLCACSEATSLTSNKAKKQCLKDTSETVKATLEKLDAYQK